MRFRVVAFILICIAASVTFAQSTRRILDTAESAAVASPPQSLGNDPTNVDLMSLFRAAFQSYAESGGQGVTFSYKIPGLGTRLAGKAEIALRQPKLNQKFAAALSGQPDRVVALEKEMTFADDISYVLTIGPTTSKSEKKIEQALASAQEALYEEVRMDSAGAATEKSRAIRRRAPRLSQLSATPAVRSMRAETDAANLEQDFQVYDAILRSGDLQNVEALANIRGAADSASPESAAELIATMDQLAAARALVDEITKTVAVVAANQSKFTLNASYRDRHDFAGPDEWTVKSGYEWGVGTNVAKRLESRNDTCARTFRAMAKDSSCGADYAKVLKETSDDSDVKMGTRVAFALEYKEFSKVSLTQPVAFELKGSRSVIASLSAGRDLLPKDDLPARARLELSIAYDDVRDDNAPDKNRKDRLIGKLTYQHRITEKVTVPITLTYANHDDYLTDVDRKLNAHFGISYKLPDLTKR